MWSETLNLNCVKGIKEITLNTRFKVTFNLIKEYMNGRSSVLFQGEIGVCKYTVFTYNVKRNRK